MDWAFAASAFVIFTFRFFFFFFSRVLEYCGYCLINSNSKCWLFAVNSVYIYCSRTHKFYFLSIFSLKMGPTLLFTYLKIILLQCFQFSVFSFQFQQNKFYPNTPFITLVWKFMSFRPVGLCCTNGKRCRKSYYY